MKTLLIHYINTEDQLKSLNAEYAKEALKKLDKDILKLYDEREELRQRLASYGDLSSNPAVLHKVVGGITQDMQGNDS